jgi:hypothetical protein
MPIGVKFFFSQRDRECLLLRRSPILFPRSVSSAVGWHKLGTGTGSHNDRNNASNDGHDKDEHNRDGARGGDKKDTGEDGTRNG